MKPPEAVLQLAKRAWPLMLEAWHVYDRLVKSNPDLPDQVKRQVQVVRERVLEVAKRRSPEARILGMLQLARDMAEQRADAEGEGSRTESQAWVRQADDIQRALEVAQAAEGANRKRMLRRVRARTDALVAEVFEALIPGELAAEEPVSSPRASRLQRLRRRVGGEQG